MVDLRSCSIWMFPFFSKVHTLHKIHWNTTIFFFLKKFKIYIPFFTFAPMPCRLLCCICFCFWLFCWLLRVNGKRVCLYWFLGSIRKRRNLYMFLVMLSLGFFKRLVWLLWRVVDGLNPLGLVGKEGTFCIFGLGKGSSYGVLEGWNNGTFCICYVTIFLLYLICLYWIVLKNSQCYCPLYLDRLLGSKELGTNVFELQCVMLANHDQNI